MFDKVVNTPLSLEHNFFLRNIFRGNQNEAISLAEIVATTNLKFSL